ncbi:MAG TPA: adenylate/guanylate cyclase domain-containing protein [Beijerinckiaceae bacterium]|jgi:adenylate cyclase
MTARLKRAQALLAGTGAAAALLWGAQLSRLHLEGRAMPLDRLEAPLLDMRHLLVGPRKPPGEVVIVAIDDATVTASGQYPLSRALVTQLVREVHRRGPKSIALDLLFVDPGPPAEDEALGTALRETGAVIAAAALFPQEPAPVPTGSDPLGTVARADRVVWPVARVAQGPVGLVNISTDHGGTPRHVPLVVGTGGGPVPSFVLRAVSQALGRDPLIEEDRVTIAQTVTRTDLGLNLPLRFYGPRRSIPTVSAAALLRGAGADPVIRDRIVVIGATAVGTGDTFSTPFDAVVPGVEVLATAISHLATGDGLVRDRAIRRIDSALAVSGALGAALLIALVPVGPALGILALSVLAWIVGNTLAFGQGLWLSLTLPLAAAIPVASAVLFARVVLDRRHARRLAAAALALRRFQPPALADRIATDPTFLAEPLAQEAGIVFLDLSGYTRLSETLGPAASRTFLAAFHALIDEEVRHDGGIVLSFMGDGAMIVFGLPDPSPQDGPNTLAAASALLDRIGAWLAGQADPRVAGLAVRVGAHYGPVVLSRLGGGSHQHITATGDSVNVASRLLEVAKQLGAGLVVSETLCKAAPGFQGRFDGHRTVDIRGRRQPLAVVFRLARTTLPAGA